MRTYNSENRTLISLLTSVISLRLVASNSNVSGSHHLSSLLMIVVQFGFLTARKRPLTLNRVVIYYIPIWFQGTHFSEMIFPVWY